MEICLLQFYRKNRKKRVMMIWDSACLIRDILNDLVKFCGSLPFKVTLDIVGFIFVLVIYICIRLDFVVLYELRNVGFMSI